MIATRLTFSNAEFRALEQRIAAEVPELVADFYASLETPARKHRRLLSFSAKIPVPQEAAAQHRLLLLRRRCLRDLRLAFLQLWFIVGLRFRRHRFCRAERLVGRRVDPHADELLLDARVPVVLYLVIGSPGQFRCNFRPPAENNFTC